MKGGESDFFTYLLRYLILFSSVTDRRESYIQCPAYGIKLIKVEEGGCNGIFGVETQRDYWYTNNILAIGRLV